MRLRFARLDLRDKPGVISDFFWDLHLLRYPWGDSRWRPFASVGIGTTNFRFTDSTGTHFNEYVVHFPISFGMKYYHRKWLVFRVDVLGNIAIGGRGLNTMRNVSLTGGAEIHFGDWRRGYYPWNPPTMYW